MEWSHSNSALFWAPEKAGVRQPILILSPCLGTPENVGVTQHLCPVFFGLREGRGEAANYDYLPALGVGAPGMHGLRSKFRPLVDPGKGKGEAANSDILPALGVGDPRECRGYVALPPSFGPARREG